MTYLSDYAVYASAMEALAVNHPTVCTRVELDRAATNSGRRIHALTVNPPGADPLRPAALVVGGIHARELAPPAAVFSFVQRLIQSFADGKDIVYPAFADGPVPYAAWTLGAAEARRMVQELALIVVPVANPDGRDHVLGGEAGWRGNRNLAACAAFGVDLNRNFRVGWDVAKSFVVVWLFLSCLWSVSDSE